jgi:hypothetical protein
MAMTAGEFTKICEGPPGHVRDYFRKLKIFDAQTVAPMTNTQLKESGAGFWADMARQGATVIS